MTAYGGDPYGYGPTDPYQGQPVAPVPGWQPYPNPGSWEPAAYLPRAGIPGTLIAATIVGYLLAALLLFVGLFLVFFGSVFADAVDFQSNFRSSATAFLIAGLGNWLAAAAFITGGVSATMRRPFGLIAMLVGSGLVVALSVYWAVLFPYSAIVVWSVLLAVVAIVPAALVLPPGIRRWMATPPSPWPPAPPPFPRDQYGRPFGS